MSLSVIVIALKCKFGGSQRKLIGIKLADCADDEGRDIFPSHETMATVAECSTKTVQRTLNEWVDLNLLYKTQPNGTNGRVHLNYNMCLLEALADGDVEFYKTNPGSRDPSFSLRSTQKSTGRTVHCGQNDMDGPSRKLDGPSLEVDGPSRKSDGPSTKPIYNLSITSHNNLEGGNDDLLKLLFEEFKQAAEQFKFVVPRDSTFKVNIDNFKTTIETLGVDAWREALAYAMTDKACTGKLPPMAGHDKPWRLSFVKMCDTDWLVRKLDYWRDQNPTPQIVTMTDAIMITPDDDCWDDWLAYYQVTQPGRARLMVNYKQFAVETKTPPKIEETPCK
jgi:hypothetical protein